MVKHLLYINWDGFAWDWYNLAQQHGGTPALDRLMAQGTVLQSLWAGIPAITNPMQQTLVSGAWPRDTGNCYAYWDKKAGHVVQTGRLNKTENFCEAALRHGLSVASVHGWFFENRGCVEGDAARPYIQQALPNFVARADVLNRLIEGEVVYSGDTPVQYKESLPALMAIYADDIDSTCHNGRAPYPSMQLATTRAQWYDNLGICVHEMDAGLARIVKALETRGILQDTAIVLTADHGGSPFGGATQPPMQDDPHAWSQIDALAAALAQSGPGYRVQVLRNPSEKALPGTQLLLMPLGTQAQVYDLQGLAPGALEQIRQDAAALPFIGAALDKAEQAAHGAGDEFADLYITAASPWHLSVIDNVIGVAGTHASMEETCHHVFGLFHGAGIAKGLRINRPLTLVDIAPTICRLLGFSGPAQATGHAIDEVFAQEGSHDH